MSDWDELSIIHGKMLGRSNDAVATFWRLVTWARGPSAKARPGFVTRDQIKANSGGLSGKRLDKVIAELVDAGKPKYDHGLLDPAEGGWWIHDFAHYPRAVDVVAALAPVPVEPPAPAPTSAVSAARAAAGRAGGLRSAESRRASKQTAQPPKQTPEANPPFASAPSKQTPKQTSGSSSPVELLSDSGIQEIPKENPPPKDLSVSDAREICFDEEEDFSKLGIRERAARVNAKPELALEAKPHRWPEVVAIVRAFVVATGRERPCLAYERDRGVRAAVALLEGWDVETIAQAIPTAVKTDWWRSKPRDMGQLSGTVIEDALVRLGDQERRAARRLRSVVPDRPSAKPEPAGISLTEFLKDVPAEKAAADG